MQTTAIFAVLNIISGSVRAETAAVTNWSSVYFGIGGRYSTAPSSPTLSFADPSDEIDGPSGIIPYADPEPYIAGADLPSLPAGASKMGFDLSFGVDRQVGDWVNGLRIDLSTGIEGTAFNIDQVGTYTTTTLSTSTSTTGSSVSTSYSTSFYYSTTSSSTSTSFTTTTTTSFAGSSNSTTTNLTYETSVSVGETTSYFSSVTSSDVSTSFSTTFFTTDVTTTGTTYPEWASNISGRAEVDWMTSVNFRSGITSGRNLFYGLAGVAVAQVTTTAEARLSVEGVTQNGEYSSVVSAQSQDVLVGYSLGIGLEHMLGDANRSSLYGEYRYTDLGSVKVELTGTGQPAVTGTYEQNFTSQNLSVGWRFRF